jgi:hypothetical protein
MDSEGILQMRVGAGAPKGKGQLRDKYGQEKERWGQRSHRALMPRSGGQKVDFAPWVKEAQINLKTGLCGQYGSGVTAGREPGSD